MPDPRADRLQTEILAKDKVCRQIIYSKIMVEVDGEVRYFYEDQELRPEAVINWLSIRTIRSYEILKSFEAQGIRVVNRAEPWWISGSDFMTSLVLHEHGLAHPYCWHAPSGSGLTGNRNRLECPLLHMPSGTLGHRNLVYLEDTNALDNRLQAFRMSQRSLDFQKAREGDYLGLVEVLVLSGKALVAWTTGRPRNQMTSLGQIISQRPRNKIALLSMEDDFAKKAEKAAQAIGLDFCSVELYQYPDGWEVARLQSTPDFKEVEDNFGYNLAGEFASSSTDG